MRKFEGFKIFSIAEHEDVSCQYSNGDAILMGSQMHETCGATLTAFIPRSYSMLPRSRSMLPQSRNLRTAFETAEFLSHQSTAKGHLPLDSDDRETAIQCGESIYISGVVSIIIKASCSELTFLWG